MVNYTYYGVEPSLTSNLCKYIVYSALLIFVIIFKGMHHLQTLINTKLLSANYQTSFTCNGQEIPAIKSSHYYSSSRCDSRLAK